MAMVVMVHGIGTPSEGGSDAMRSAWVQALTAGSRDSARASLAGSSAMVWYRDWSWATVPGAQGADVDLDALSEAERAFVEELAEQWLAEAAEADDPDLAEPAETEVDQLGPPIEDGAQGPMQLTRTAVAGLTRVPLFAEGGFATLARITRFNLWQVAAYVNDRDGTKAQVLERFTAAVSEDTRVVIAHSLGSLAAYEAIHQLGLPVRLLLTIGSPLGMRRLIHPRLSPVGTYPASVGRWVNAADHDDPVASDPTLADCYPPPDGGVLEDLRVHNRGRFAWHSATAYLAHDQVRREVWEALADG